VKRKVIDNGGHGQELLRLSSKQVRSVHPRDMPACLARRGALETCRYFETCGKCAFGPTCRKIHNPRLLSDDAVLDMTLILNLDAVCFELWLFSLDTMC